MTPVNKNSPKQKCNIWIYDTCICGYSLTICAVFNLTLRTYMIPDVMI